MRAKTGISERRACGLVGVSRTVLHYEARPEVGNAIVRSRMIALAAERRRFGYRRIHVTYIPRILAIITHEFRPASQARNACAGTPSRSRV
jgi:hypothetical protein